MMAMTYGHVYVAQIALGSKDAQTLKAFTEAEEYEGTALIIALSPCIAHGYNLDDSLNHERMAVDSGHWPLYRFDPRRVAQGKPPLQLDSSPPRLSLSEMAAKETRFTQVAQSDPERYQRLLKAAEQAAQVRYQRLKFWSEFVPPGAPKS
jgi:pyruvate-ferredoxin/flavodoxin oxidoreductase